MASTHTVTHARTHAHVGARMRHTNAHARVGTHRHTGTHKYSLARSLLYTLTARPEDRSPANKHAG